jgi:hypothetical protein
VTATALRYRFRNRRRPSSLGLDILMLIGAIVFFIAVCLLIVLAGDAAWSVWISLALHWAKHPRSWWYCFTHWGLIAQAIAGVFYAQGRQNKPK